MKSGMTFEYLMCRADLNFDVDFGVNAAIGTIVQDQVGSYCVRIMYRFHP